MPADLFKIIARFEDANGKPLGGEDYKVRLLDKDHFFDDKLGVSALDSDGKVEFFVSAADIVSIDSPDERTPDVYFSLSKGGDEIFVTEVFPDVSFDTEDPVTGRPKGLTKEFGPFRVDI